MKFVLTLAQPQHPISAITIIVSVMIVIVVVMIIMMVIEVRVSYRVSLYILYNIN